MSGRCSTMTREQPLCRKPLGLAEFFYAENFEHGAAQGTPGGEGGGRRGEARTNVDGRVAGSRPPRCRAAARRRGQGRCVVVRRGEGVEGGGLVGVEAGAEDGGAEHRLDVEEGGDAAPPRAVTGEGGGGEGLGWGRGGRRGRGRAAHRVFECAAREGGEQQLGLMAFLPTAVAMVFTDYAVAHSWWWCAKESRRQPTRAAGAAPPPPRALAAQSRGGGRARPRLPPRLAVARHVALRSRRRACRGGGAPAGASEPTSTGFACGWTRRCRAPSSWRRRTPSRSSASNRADSAGCASAALSTTDSSRTISLRRVAVRARCRERRRRALAYRGMLSASCSQNVRRRRGVARRTPARRGRGAGTGARALADGPRPVVETVGEGGDERRRVRFSAAVGSLAASSPAQRHAASRTAWFSASAMPT